MYYTQDKDGVTPLMIQAYEGTIEDMESLLSFGADLSITSNVIIILKK
jgi:ankyrin repeat protein